MHFKFGLLFLGAIPMPEEAIFRYRFAHLIFHKNLTAVHTNMVRENSKIRNLRRIFLWIWCLQQSCSYRWELYWKKLIFEKKNTFCHKNLIWAILTIYTWDSNGFENVLFGFLTPKKPKKNTFGSIKPNVVCDCEIKTFLEDGIFTKICANFINV